MSGNSSYYKIKNNQTVTPKSIAELISDNHCHKNNYSESFKKKDNKIKSFKLKKIPLLIFILFYALKIKLKIKNRKSQRTSEIRVIN